MDTAGQVTSESHGHGSNVAHELLGQRQTTYNTRSGEGRTTNRKPTPSPLQVSETPVMAAGDAAHNNPRSPKSPTAMRAASDYQPSPLSPRFNQNSGLDQPRPPRDRVDQRSMLENNPTIGDLGSREELGIKEAIASPTKAQSYSQLRNVSSPLPPTKPLGNSSPPSPQSTAYPPFTSPAVRPESRPMPRTSSIDSAISTISLGTLNVQHQSQDAHASTTAEISNLIQTAGSAEAVIQHLLREKQHSAAQNAQLWKLVDKQRSLVLGLNQDLEKALKDKEKYRRRLREHLDSVPPVPSATHRGTEPQPRAATISPAPSEASTATDLPIQGQSIEQTHPNPAQGINRFPTPTHRKLPSVVLASDMTPTAIDEAEDWVRSKTWNEGTKHSHKTTSSSDVGILGPSRPAPSVSPIRTNGLDSPKQNKTLEQTSHNSQTLGPEISSTNSFTAKRSQPFTGKPFNAPTLALTESTPTGSDLERMTPPRKAPPAPLDLGTPKREDSNAIRYGPEDHSESDYDDDVEVDELPALGRGRKKTREDDDREREVAQLKEEQERSRSKKTKGSKSRNGSAKSTSKDETVSVQPHTIPIPSSIKALSPEPSTPAGSSMFLSPPTSLAGVLSPIEPRNVSVTTQRTLLMKPMSPGLPLSPRPNHRPTNPPTPRLPREGAGASIASAPLSPRGLVGLPLSPRAPRQPIPLLPHTPMSMASPMQLNMSNDSETTLQEPTSPTKSMTYLQTHLDPLDTDGSRSRGVYKGFVSDAYPDLLLPPNALPSILVKVVSSRLKPSRHSLVLRGSDEEPVFTLGISARSDRQALWQVEKPILSLQQLDQQLRSSHGFNVKLPDRSLFTGHAPAKIDARRIALERYFETLLDTPMEERAALILCRYLSTQVSAPASEEINGVTPTPHSGSPVTQGADERFLKQGYLTKRGKNFGGWKARFFILDEPVLKYYETPGGSLLGTIKLHNAQIGKQSQHRSSNSPSRGIEDGEGQYRHAFLIREPKRKDSNSFMDHVLCAESDSERDSWVAALLCYVDSPGFDSRPRPSLPSNDSGSTRVIRPSKKTSIKDDMIANDSPSSENFDSLQAVPYETTQQAEAPHVRITPDPRPNATPSPTTSGSQPPGRAQSVQSAQSKAISAPSNGARIEDVGAWGNKPPAISAGHQKEHKKRGIWGFRDKNPSDVGSNQPNESNLSLPQQQYQEQITNVKAAFGAPLAEAVEYCAPHGIDVCLPAVVYRCLEYLEAKDAASEEGIFRMSGSNVVIKGLRGRFNAEGDIDLLAADEQYFDVHAVASLLKLYLRELPQPVLTRELHLHFISVLGKQDPW